MRDLGKANYCLNGPMEKGWLKARNFNNINNPKDKPLAIAIVDLGYVGLPLAVEFG